MCPGGRVNAFRMFTILIDNLGGIEKGTPGESLCDSAGSEREQRGLERVLGPALPLNKRLCRQERDAGDSQVTVAGVGDGPVIDVYQNQTVSFL